MSLRDLELSADVEAVRAITGEPPVSITTGVASVVVHAIDRTLAVELDVARLGPKLGLDSSNVSAIDALVTTLLIFARQPVWDWSSTVTVPLSPGIAVIFALDDWLEASHPEIFRKLEPVIGELTDALSLILDPSAGESFDLRRLADAVLPKLVEAGTITASQRGVISLLVAGVE